MEYKLIRLLSGEELLCSVIEQTATTFTIENVLIIYHQVDERRNQVTVSFAPFMPHSEGKLTLNTHAIAAISDPKSQLVDQYRQMFSNIIIAPTLPQKFS